MTNAVAGWYPDPQGDDEYLYYWDGDAWTGDKLPTRTQTDAGTVPVGQPASQPQPQQSQAGTTNVYVIPDGRLYNTGAYARALYPMSSTDRTLRLVAFIWNVIMLASTCWAVIPLAWEIPMLVRSWGIYKGTKPNTTAFGVCNLLFFGFISGVLLLCSNKDA